MNPLDWIVRFCEVCARPLLRFFGSPQMEIQSGWLGWSDRDRQQFVLLLWVKFINAKEKPFLLRSLEVEHRGVKYKAIAKLGDVSILGSTGWRVGTLLPKNCAVASPQIPAIDVADRHGYFSLPKHLADNAGGFQFEVSATFHGGRSRTGKFTVDTI